MSAIIIYSLLGVCFSIFYLIVFFVSSGYIENEFLVRYFSEERGSIYTHLTFLLLSSVTSLLIFEKYLNLKNIKGNRDTYQSILKIEESISRLDFNSHIEEQKMKNYGGICCIHDKFPQDLFLSGLSNSNDIFILNTFIPHLGEFRKNIQDALLHGSNITFLLLNPMSDAAKLRTDLLYQKNSVRIPSVKDKIKENIDELRLIKKNLNGSCKGKIVVKFYPYYPPCSIYKTDDFLFVGLFHVNELAVLSPQLQISNNNYIYSKSIIEELTSFDDLSLEININKSDEELDDLFRIQLQIRENE
jgi:hypothetical protein